jgi:hypothetical protein
MRSHVVRPLREEQLERTILLRSKRHQHSGLAALREHLNRIACWKQFGRDAADH